MNYIHSDPWWHCMSDLDEIYKLYPPTYERSLGEALGPKFSNIEVPVPPQWVQKFAHVPRGCETACLAKELEDIYPPAARDVMVEYVKSWDEVKRHGYHLVLGGISGTYKRRMWAASAVANELVMRYGQTHDLSVTWESVMSIRHAMQARKDNYEVYNTMYKRVMKSKLLLMLEPTRVTRGSDEWYMIEDIYMARGDNLLPTITTIADPLEDDKFAGVKTLLGNYIAETLQIYAKYRATI